MRYVFGPVPSRRLGQSLGIDVIPLKTCNWNCVYCQLGRTIPLTNERKEYVPAKDVLTEISHFLDNNPASEIDWISFVGSGEPTLHSRLGWLIRCVKALTDIPVAVITNGSLLYMPEVRLELLQADAVMPSLDAGNRTLYKHINRPHPHATFEHLVEGLVEFRKEYEGQLWIEVMLMKGLNDSREALQALAGILHKIGPDAVHINLPIRPATETWVQPPDEESLQQALDILGQVARVMVPRNGSYELDLSTNIVEAVIAIVSRHPMRQEELERTLARQWTPSRIKEALATLEQSGQLQVVERSGIRFWSAAASTYPSEVQSKAAAVHLRCRKPPVTLLPIGFVQNAFDDPAPLEIIKAQDSQIIVKPEYVEGLEGLQVGEHLLVIFQFHRTNGYELQQHPRRDESRPKRGVFALRSPRRPNPIGVTEVELLAIEENVLRVRGLDALNNTPVLDIKPA